MSRNLTTFQATLGLAGVAVVVLLGILYAGFNRGVDRRELRRAQIDDEIARSCTPWKVERKSFSRCVIAWEIWRRCRSSLEKIDGEVGGTAGVICTHLEFRFQERLDEEIGAAVDQIRPGEM